VPGPPHDLGERRPALGGQGQTGVAQVVKVHPVQPETPASGLPGTLDMVSAEVAAIGTHEQPGGRHHRAAGSQVLTEDLDPRVSQVHRSYGGGLGRRLNLLGTDLYELALDAHRSGVEVHVAAAQREDLPEAQVAPERHEDESAQILGHCTGEGRYLLTVQEGALRRVGLPGSPDPAGVACQRLVVNGVARMARSVP